MSEQNEIYSLLIPLENERLLLPRICVAEVIAYTENRAEPGEEPGGLLVGIFDWSGRRLPVIALDEPVEARAPAGRNRRRIAVLHGLTDALKGRHYGIVTHGFPQLIRVNPDVLTLDPQNSIPEGKPYLCRARMIHESPLIPDVERIELMVANY